MLLLVRMNALVGAIDWLKRIFRPSPSWSADLVSRRRTNEVRAESDKWMDAAGENRFLVLPCNHVIRLTRQSNVCRIIVEEGLVWLTTTPAKGDVILNTGSEYLLDQSWPIVIEALADTRLRLERGDSSLIGMITAGKNLPLRL